MALTYIFYSLDLIGKYWDPENTLMLVETNLPTSYLAGFMSIGRMVFIELGLIGDSPPQKQSARTGGELGLQSSLGRDSVRWQTLATH